MKRTIFSGVATAVPTPFCFDGGVDHAAFSALTKRQFAAGVKTLVVASTTGEGSTLSCGEALSLLETALTEAADSGGKIIGAVCENDTARAATLARTISKTGVGALLAITPFYNKTNDNGLIRHFFAIADASEKPIILYNVPSRTGMTISPALYKKLASHPNIYGVKEASSNFDTFFLARALTNSDFSFYSGCDETFIPFCLCGGSGVISVLSNVCPKAVLSCWEGIIRRDIKSLLSWQRAFNALIALLFCEVNPIPLKFALSYLGLCNNVLRLPLTPLGAKNEKRLISALNAVRGYL